MGSFLTFGSCIAKVRQLTSYLTNNTAAVTNKLSTVNPINRHVIPNEAPNRLKKQNAINDNSVVMKFLP